MKYSNHCDFVWIFLHLQCVLKNLQDLTSLSPLKSTMLHAFPPCIHSVFNYWNFQSDTLYTIHDKHVGKKQSKQSKHEQGPTCKVSICLMLPMFLESDQQSQKGGKVVAANLYKDLLLFENYLLDPEQHCHVAYKPQPGLPNALMLVTMFATSLCTFSNSALSSSACDFKYATKAF